MEITTKQTAAMFPVFIAVISATVLVIAWRTTCGMYVNESMKQSESVQLNVNAGLIGKVILQFLARIYVSRKAAFSYLRNI